MLLRDLVILVDVGCRHGSRPSVVDRGQLRTILRSKILMLHLGRRRLHMTFVGELIFLRAGLAHNAAGSVEAGVVYVDDGVLIDDGAILVNIGYVTAAKIRACAVVCEGSAAPLTAKEADAAIAEAVI